METVIIVSVLSTLCAVALVGSIVVLYRKSKNKVDVGELNEYRREIDERLNSISNRIDEDVRNIYNHVDERERELRSENDGIRSLIDSRCDKLHSLITSTSSSDQLSFKQKHKQILKS